MGCSFFAVRIDKLTDLANPCVITYTYLAKLSHPSVRCRGGHDDSYIRILSRCMLADDLHTLLFVLLIKHILVCKRQRTLE